MVEVRPTYELMRRIKESVYDWLELEDRGYCSYPIPEGVRMRMLELAAYIDRTGADMPQGPVLKLDGTRYHEEA